MTESLGNGITRAHTVACTTTVTHDDCACPFVFWAPRTTPRKRVKVFGSLQDALNRREQMRQHAWARRGYAAATMAQRSITIPVTIPTFAEHVERVFAVSWRHCTAETIRCRRCVYERRIAPAFDHLCMNEITVDTVEYWITGLIDQHGRTSALDQAFDLLRSIMFHYTKRRGLLNPCALIPHPRDPGRRINHAKDKVITREQYAQLLTACRTDSETLLIRTAVEAGLRVGELAGLQVGDIDTEACTINVVRRGHSPMTKTRKGRVVAICADLAGVYERHMESVTNSQPGSYIWQGRGGRRKPYVQNAPYHSAALALTIRKIIGRAGLVDADGKPVTSPHGLRATGATIAAAAGIPAQIIQNQLGHSRLGVTEKSYLGKAEVGALAVYAEVFG